MNDDTSQQRPVVRSESRADAELAEDQARQADLSRAMEQVEADAVETERVTRQHMVTELAVQREERDQECTEAALAAAESEGMPPRPASSRTEPAAAGPTHRRWRDVRNAGPVAAILAVLGVLGGGSVLLLRRRRD